MQHRCLTCIHKYYSVDEWKEFAKVSSNMDLAICWPIEPPPVVYIPTHQLWLLLICSVLDL
jgi:hypothetical protein